jgi:DNA-directed RNA polymerase subunit N (RpoN/RPB10)
MHIEELNQEFQKLMNVIEDLFIDKQCCRNLIIEKRLMTESSIDAAMTRA